MDARMGIWSYIVTDVRDRYHYYKISFYTLTSFSFIKLYAFVDYSLQIRKLWEKLFFTMSSKLQWYL